MTYKLSDSKGKGNIGAEPIDYTKRLSSEEGGLEEHEVTFTNRGICPNNCQVSVAVTDSSNRTVWSYSADRTHVMSPLPLRFRPHITGFLIKLWQWQDQVSYVLSISPYNLFLSFLFPPWKTVYNIFIH